MRKKLPFILSVVVIFSILTCTLSIPVQAEFKPNVKNCLEQPDKCDDEEKQEGVQKEVEEDTNTDIDASSVTTSVTFMDYVKMVFALLFVVALIYFLLKFINKRSRSYNQTKIFHNLGGTPLGGNRSVQLVKVGNKLLILGVGEDIQLLKEIEDEQEKEEMLHYFSNDSTQMAGAKEFISNWFPKGNSGKSSSPNEAEPFQSVLKNQLDEVRKGRKKLLEDLKNKENNHHE
ncbi:flagellar biosynthetic protein FliO [Bacillus seohaeanensis]|uniref:Flagellar biosynthetic protein FliO n=1 Tax=Bacillus seohaeanensis TaxID=284580 RepID=A0ABW5RXF8_9BACI